MLKWGRWACKSSALLNISSLSKLFTLIPIKLKLKILEIISRSLQYCYILLQNVVAHNCTYFKLLECTSWSVHIFSVLSKSIQLLKLWQTGSDLLEHLVAWCIWVKHNFLLQDFWWLSTFTCLVPFITEVNARNIRFRCYLLAFSVWHLFISAHLLVSPYLP